MPRVTPPGTQVINPLNFASVRVGIAAAQVGVGLSGSGPIGAFTIDSVADVARGNAESNAKGGKTKGASDGGAAGGGGPTGGGGGTGGAGKGNAPGGNSYEKIV